MEILSAVQFSPRLARGPADVSDNFRRLEPYVRQAAELGTSFLVLPELCLTGYSFMNPDEAAAVAEPHDGPTFRKMAGVARALSSYVTWGYVESDGHSLYNSASMVDPDGKLVTGYRKVNLWGNDFLWARPGGKSAPVVKTRFGNTSLVICRDLRDKIPDNIPRIAASGPPLFDGQAMDLVAACVNWGKGGFPSTSWMEFVANNKCTLVVCNRWGTEERDDVGRYELEFGHGGSCIVQPDWTVHTGGLRFSENCVVTAAL